MTSPPDTLSASTTPTANHVRQISGDDPQQPPPSRPHGTSAIISLDGVTKTYYKPDGSVLVEALRGVSLTVRRGEFVAVMGSSGSGKSTLMNILGCLDKPTGGRYLLDGSDVSKLDDQELSHIRGRKIGFVFQAFNLISALTIAENVEVPLFYQGVHRSERLKRAQECLELVGLGDRIHHRPSELSGGQQQRAAIARSLITNPSVIMADEPTGNLDSKTGTAILDILDQLHKKGMTILMVTHDDNIAERCERIVRLKDGELEFDRVLRRTGILGGEAVQSVDG